jgi:hypothetical protein
MAKFGLFNFFGPGNLVSKSFVPPFFSLNTAMSQYSGFFLSLPSVRSLSIVKRAYKKAIVDLKKRGTYGVSSHAHALTFFFFRKAALFFTSPRCHGQVCLSRSRRCSRRLAPPTPRRWCCCRCCCCCCCCCWCCGCCCSAAAFFATFLPLCRGVTEFAALSCLKSSLDSSKKMPSLLFCDCYSLSPFLIHNCLPFYLPSSAMSIFMFSLFLSPKSSLDVFVYYRLFFPVLYPCVHLHILSTVYFPLNLSPPFSTSNTQPLPCNTLLLKPISSLSRSVSLSWCISLVVQLRFLLKECQSKKTGKL